MTVIRTDSPPVHASAPDAARSEGHLFHAVSPYLVAAGGDWRSAEPTRDHRCAATRPAASPAPAKQRALCLSASHVTCATYRAARELEEEASVAPTTGGGGLWPATTSTVLALEPPRARAFLSAGSRARSTGQLLLVALMLAAFGALLVARTTAPPGAPGSSFTAAVAASAGATAEATPSPTVVPTVTPPPTPAPESPGPSPAATPTAIPSPTAPSETYRVKRGDTLSSIAVAHGVTVKQLKKANDLTSNLIRVGQELVIP